MNDCAIHGWQSAQQLCPTCAAESLRFTVTTVQGAAQPMCGTYETYKHLYEPVEPIGPPALPSQPWPSEVQIEGLKDYVTWFGAAHAENCPGDDTCACACKPLNDAVNSILSESFDRAVAGPPALQALTWQPIETAPTDGTKILVYIKNGRLNWTVTARTLDHVDGWYTDPGKHHVRPSHWMPIPDPPALLVSSSVRPDNENKM